MGAIHFYLKKAEESTGKSLIYLKYKYQGRVLVFTFGQTIDPKLWNEDKERVKSNRTTTADGKHSLNDLLDNLEAVLEKAYNDNIKNGIPEPGLLKLKLIQFMERKGDGEEQSDFFSLADRFIKGEIKFKGKDKTKNTLKPYQTVTKHLKAFEIAERYPVSFDTINLNFYYKYISYLKTQRVMDAKRGGKTVKVKSNPLSQNTIAKHIQIIKVFLNEALDLGYTTNVQFKNRKFTASWVESDAVYLTEKELTNLFKHDFSAKKNLERVRDLFVFGCYVGLRYSDYSNVKPENIIIIEGDKFIKLKTQKTREQVYIPCSPVVLEIFERYSDSPNYLPRALSNQKFNDYIKEACREAKLTEKGRLVTAPEKELWECVSSHTARRSFATNLYLDGYPTIEIMKITGHRTEKSFLKYIRVSKLEAAKKLSAHMKKRWSEKLLRVA